MNQNSFTITTEGSFTFLCFFFPHNQSLDLIVNEEHKKPFNQSTLSELKV